MNPKQPFLVVLLLAMMAVLGIRPTIAGELPVIEVGLPNDGLTGLGGQYILDKGLDRKNGFVMKPRWAGAPEVQRLLGIQAISVGLMTPEPALRANLNGVPIRLIQPYMVPHFHVLVAKEAPYQSVEELRGRPLAITPDVSMNYNLFDFIMRKRGITKEFKSK